MLIWLVWAPFKKKKNPFYFSKSWQLEKETKDHAKVGVWNSSIVNVTVAHVKVTK